jgi:hypothetical protein
MPMTPPPLTARRPHHPRAERCGDCGGSGADPKTGQSCGACNGLGEIYCVAVQPVPPGRLLPLLRPEQESASCLTS